MRSVLLVDDERLIVEGIAKVLDWSGLGLRLAGTARNGLEALEAIERERPDLVLTDIRMPGLDGLGLVERTAERHTRIRFAMLTGYKDFDYARRAMQHGVRHYLLKPCSEQQIGEALTELARELEEEDERDGFLSEMEQRYRRMLPHVKEQFLKEFITNRTYGSRDLALYQSLFGMELDGRPVRLMLLSPAGEPDYAQLFALSNIAAELIPGILLSTTIDGTLLVVLDDGGEPDDEAARGTDGAVEAVGTMRVKEAKAGSPQRLAPELEARIGRVQETFRRFYKLEATAALSSAGRMVEARRLYREARECLAHRFYVGDDSLIVRSDLPAAQGAEALPEPDEERLCLLLRSGLADEARLEIERFLGELAERRAALPAARSCVLQLYAAMIRVCPEAEAEAFTLRAAELSGIDTLAGLGEFVTDSAMRLADHYHRLTLSRQSSAVERLIAIIEQDYADSGLTLGAVAAGQLFMNADYVGKMFKKATGESFSAYLNRHRIREACRHIRSGGDARVAELAERFGFGDNAPYFSQVFKKWTGRTPSEFKKCPSDF
ncbi:response regulator transcription factor [Paenibacillus pasadenensis]|uniref:response regulator n=1 Tax=Paenibacillus pasadenensis TaxID=217090 RepID=UPI0003F839F8|nr:response regulator [Paenibacillus pasadenensis]